LINVIPLDATVLPFAPLQPAWRSDDPLWLAVPMRLGCRNRLSSSLNLSGIAWGAWSIGKKRILPHIILGVRREFKMGDGPISLHSSRREFKSCSPDSARDEPHRQPVEASTLMKFPASR